MTSDSPIWPAQLDHLCLSSDDPAMLADYYANVFGYHQSDLPEGRFLLQGPGRRLVVRGGAPGERPYHGYRLQSSLQLEEVRVFAVHAQKVRWCDTYQFARLAFPV